MGSSACGIQSCESHEGHLGVLTEIFPKSLEVYSFGPLRTLSLENTGKHHTLSPLLLGNVLSVWKSWAKSVGGKLGDVAAVPGDAALPAVEPVLEQVVGKAPSQDVAFQPEEDLEILRGFAKMSLRRKIDFLTCDLWHELFLLVFVFQGNKVSKLQNKEKPFFMKWCDNTG